MTDKSLTGMLNYRLNQTIGVSAVHGFDLGLLDEEIKPQLVYCCGVWL